MLEIRGGRLVDGALRPRAISSSDFWDYCHTDENSDRVGELAFGTNLGLREMIGILLQDEKVPGVHLAFGDPYGSQTHADWTSRTHVDVLTRDCDVWIDDEQVIAEGQVSARSVRPAGAFADAGLVESELRRSAQRSGLRNRQDSTSDPTDASATSNGELGDWSTSSVRIWQSARISLRSC